MGFSRLKIQGKVNNKTLNEHHLSPSGILNQLDTWKYNWWRKKANRLKREEDIIELNAWDKRKSYYSTKFKGPTSGSGILESIYLQI